MDFAASALVTVVVLLFSKFPKVHTPPKTRVGSLDMSDLALQTVCWLYFARCLLMAVAEQGTADWMSSSLRHVLRVWIPIDRADSVSWFWGLLTLALSGRDGYCGRFRQPQVLTVRAWGLWCHFSACVLTCDGLRNCFFRRGLFLHR